MCGSFQDFHAEWRDAEVVCVFVGYFEYAELYHLRDVVVPFGLREVGSCPECADCVVACPHNVGAPLTAQNVYQREYAYGSAAGAHYGAERLLGKNGAVEARGLVAADVAIAAVAVALLAEVAKEHSAPAYPCLGVCLHTGELLEVYGSAARVLGEAAQRDDITVAVEEYGFGRQTVAAGASNLLVVAFDSAGEVVVHHPADVALVDAHAEGHCGTYHLHAAVEEGAH